MPFPFHAHSAQWEFYHVLSGRGRVRDAEGMMPIGPGDLAMFVVADNPVGEAHYYPDSNNWSVPIPQRRLIRSEPLDYFDGEE